MVFHQVRCSFTSFKKRSTVLFLATINHLFGEETTKFVIHCKCTTHILHKQIFYHLLTPI